MTMLVSLGRAQFVGHLGGGNRDDLHIRRAKISRNAFAVIKNDAAAHHFVGKLPQREFVHRDQHIGMRNQRRSNPFFRQANMAVRAARAHLRTIGRQPADFQAFAHTHFDEQLAEQQHALSAEARDLDLHVFEAMAVFRTAGTYPRAPAFAA